MATLAAAGVAAARPLATPRALSAAPTCSETCAPTQTTTSSSSGGRPTVDATYAADRRPKQEPSGAGTVVSGRAVLTRTTNQHAIVPPPRISGFTPSRGPARTKVTIYCSNFSGVSRVDPGTIAAHLHRQLIDQITATVPSITRDYHQ
jgi:hypothetical protein